MIQVYHIKSESPLQQAALLRLSLGPQKMLKDLVAETWKESHFEKVAEIDTDDLEEAYKLTNNVITSWSREPDKIVKVTRPLHNIGGRTLGLKSSCVGDVFIRNNKELHFVATFGFQTFEGDLPTSSGD